MHDLVDGHDSSNLSLSEIIDFGKKLSIKWDVEFEGLHLYTAIHCNERTREILLLIPDGKKVNFRSKYHKELPDDIW